MSKITSITLQQKNKERCNIFIDNEYKFALDMETVLSLRLKVNQEVDEQEFESIVLEGQKKDALNKAVIYSTRSMKTKWQVYDYLKGKGYLDEVCWYCVDKLKDYGYVDDVNYAMRFIEINSLKEGKKLIEYKLISKGIKKEDIEKAYQLLDIPFDDLALNICLKYTKNKELNFENKNKTFKYLIGKGFSYDEVEQAISKVFK